MPDNLPECLIIEILYRLPMKPVLRFKSASKSWYAMIKSRYFISKHLKHNNKFHINCVIAQYSKPLGGSVLIPYKLGLDDERHEVNTMFESNFLNSEPPKDSILCGPCNGIYYAWVNCSGMNCRYLWNPTLNEKKILPPIIDNPNMISGKREYCGFGFDPVTEDYKVILLLEGMYDTDYSFSIMIYSLRNDSWKYAGDLSKNYYFRENSCHAFVNSCFYWLGSHERNANLYDVMITVDLVTEVSQEIELPKSRNTDESSPRTSSWKPHECLIVYWSTIGLVILDNLKSNFDKWTFKDRLWSKELSVTHSTGGQVITPLGHYCVDNNLLFFQDSSGLTLCHPDKELAFKFPVSHARCRTVSAYMESLVPVNDREYWERREEQC